MSIILTTTVADAVMAVFITRESSNVKLQNMDITVEPYHNGREHGWSLSGLSASGARTVSFSEYRSSDQIVVYFGDSADFSDGIPNDQVYKSAKFFPTGSYEKAAKFIAHYFTGK